MSQWINYEPDFEILEESALAMAQATVQKAINQAGISRAELSRKMDRPRSFVSRMLSGSHNLTIKTMSRALLACGFEMEMSLVPIRWTWSAEVPSRPQLTVDLVPAAAAGTPLLAA